VALDTPVSEFRNHSYIRRKGRITKAQTKGLTTFATDFAVTPEQVIPAASGCPVGIEVGFGMGHALLRWAHDAPHFQLFGIELYQPGIGALADRLHREGMFNVHILEYPAQEVFAKLPNACVDEVRIFFPDPWPKKRHFKRRLVQPPFVEALADVVKPKGIVRLATDWVPYAAWIRECFGANSSFAPQFDRVRPAQSGSVQENVRGKTNFERRGEKLGHDITDFEYTRR